MGPLMQLMVLKKEKKKKFYEVGEVIVSIFFSRNKDINWEIFMRPLEGIE